MWTIESRARDERRGLRYPTDLTDEEWSLAAPHIRPAKRGGRPRTTDMREVVNAILYLLGTGCQWRALPKDFPPRTTVFEYLDLWEWDRTLERIHHALYVAVRDRFHGRRPRRGGQAPSGNPDAGLEGRFCVSRTRSIGQSLDRCSGRRVLRAVRHFPAISLFVTLYGLTAHPAEVEQQLAPVRDLLPEGALGILEQQVRAVVAKLPDHLRSACFSASRLRSGVR